MRQIHELVLPGGRRPYCEWLETLDFSIQARIDTYVKRVAIGLSKKNVRRVGQGVFEIKVDLGQGYRVYFGDVGRDIILILCGGEKGTQNRDIEKAIFYWRNYVQK